jgi:hypothetical protein
MPHFVVQLNIHGAFAAGPSPVLLGTAGNFAILAKTGVSTVPDSVVGEYPFAACPRLMFIDCTCATGGNVGVSPATISSVTGFSLVQDVSTQFWTSTQVNGRVMGATDGLPTPGLLTVAVLDMQTAFTDAMSMSHFSWILINIDDFIRQAGAGFHRIESG